MKRKDRVMIIQSIINEDPEIAMRIHEDAVNKLEDAGFEVVEIHWENNCQEDQDEYLYYLSQIIRVMSTVDAVYFCGEVDRVAISARQIADTNAVRIITTADMMEKTAK